MLSPARVVALDILLRVEHHGAFASELLHSERLDSLSPADRGLCTELVMGVLRWRARLDDAIAGVSSQKLRKLDPEVLETLRLAAYQIGFLARVPDHAVVNDSVELVKRKKKRSAAPFVNAVLRKLLTNKSALQAGHSSGQKTVPDLVALYAHPLWMVERWTARYGLESTEKICQHDQSVPETSIHAVDDAVFRELESDGIKLEPGIIVTKARRVTAGDVTKTTAFTEGRVFIQDEGSQLVALLVGQGKRLLDCCAAPGGKTALLAERNPSSEVLATDVHPHRAQTLGSRLQRFSNVQVHVADATSQANAHDFDRVLADVPCSGTGTLSRNPEIKWRLVPEDLADLHARQVAILRSSLSRLGPGGRLVYSTCSLEPEENENVITEVISKSSPFELLDVASEIEQLQNAGELTHFRVQELTNGSFLRTLPGQLPMDGFFAALITTKRGYSV